MAHQSRDYEKPEALPKGVTRDKDGVLTLSWDAIIDNQDNHAFPRKKLTKLEEKPMQRKQSLPKTRTKPATATIGAAGVHFLAGCLSAMGMAVAVTQKNAPSIDLLVSSVDGTNTLAIQVKTMRWAQRLRKDKTKIFCEWRCSAGSLKKGIYAFVDLTLHKEDNYPSKLPTFYFVPVDVVRRWHHYNGGFYKPTERQISPYRSNWGAVRRELDLN